MKILLFGKNGQVGSELSQSLQPLGKVTALDRNTNHEGLCGDITDFVKIRDVFEKICPNIVVNAVAYTAVDKAENEPYKADLVNHLSLENLAKLTKKHQALLIHYSTDYVFDGSGHNPWTEDSPTNPLNVYGQSKRNGELALERSGVNFINLRTSWVYGIHGHNFIKTMLKLAKTHETLNIIHDQVGSPTSARLIADITSQIIRYYQLKSNQTVFGHYHLAPNGVCSWYEYANFIFEHAKKLGLELTIKKVNAITSKDYPTPAKRPHNSRLDTHKLQHNFDICLPQWQQNVYQTLGELIHDKTA